MGFFKNFIIKWLGFQPAEQRHIKVTESFTHDDYVKLNRVWYRADANELSQFYKALGSWGTNDSRFWTIVAPFGHSIRKIHTGLPSLMINKITSITVNDSLGIELDEEVHSEEQIALWDEIQKDNKLKKLVKDAVKDTLIDGDGAFKLSIDADISKLYPIVEFFSGERVNYEYKRGRLFEVLFKTTYYGGENKEYTLVEHYGKGYIHYELLDEKDNPVQLSILEETKNLVDVTFTGDFMMAVPLMFFESSKYKNRGQAFIDGKYDDFDALDEIWSQWIDAIRLGRAEKFVPEELLPRDEYGNRLPYNPITNQFYKLNKSMDEDKEQQPTTIQPSIESERFVLSWAQALDLCLMGLISPSTLGIDIKKLDNGEAQREKEKITGYTRDDLITVLEETIPQLVDVTFKVYNLMHSQAPIDYTATIEFGEYNNPSFEAVVETVGKAKQFRIMSTEEAVEQLYGDSKTDEEKALEVERIKAENSLAQEGAFGGMDNFFEENNQDKQKDEEGKEPGKEEEKKEPDKK